MNASSWQADNYDHALKAVQATEEEQGTLPCLLDCGNSIQAILPLGLPALGIRFHGAMMLSPLPVFMACLLAVPIIGYSISWEVSVLTVTITAACAAMILGLYRALLLLLKQRELFPRNYFCTLGPRGIALNYSRLQLPMNSWNGSLQKKEIAAIEKTKLWFPPALWVGRLFVPAIRVSSRSGEELMIPTAIGQQDAVHDAIAHWLKNK